MSQPKVGMWFEDVRRRVKRISKLAADHDKKLKLINSLLNQVELAEGKQAGEEIKEELDFDKGVSFSGRGNKQTGFGQGKRLGSGRWKYENGQWIKVD